MKSGFDVVEAVVGGTAVVVAIQRARVFREGGDGRRERRWVDEESGSGWMWMCGEFGTVVMVRWKSWAVKEVVNGARNSSRGASSVVAMFEVCFRNCQMFQVRHPMVTGVHPVDKV